MKRIIAVVIALALIVGTATGLILLFTPKASAQNVLPIDWQSVYRVEIRSIDGGETLAATENGGDISAIGAMFADVHGGWDDGPARMGSVVFVFYDRHGGVPVRIGLGENGMAECGGRFYTGYDTGLMEAMISHYTGIDFGPVLR